MAKLHVAIIGGGICGATLARALLRYPDITFAIYEYKPGFAEQGAAISLANSALQSLAMMGFDVDRLLREIGGIPYTSTTSGCGNGPDAHGVKPNTMNGAYQVNVSRSKLLHAILAGIPKEYLHTSKRLIKIEQRSERTGHQQVTLSFEDGATASADAVVGADGIRSTVRRIILGDGHPAIDPIYAGFWWCHNRLEYTKALEMMRDCELPLGLFSLYGQDGFLMCLCIDSGEHAVPYAIGMDEEWDSKSWAKTISTTDFQEYFKNWNKTSQDVVSMIADQPEITIYSEWESAIAPVYHAGAICMAGDAAHAPVPWGAHGAALAIEDSLIISRTLSHAHGPKDVPSAFKAYERTRMPRTQGIIKASREIGNIFCGKIPEVGLDARKMAPLLVERGEFMRGIDMDAHVAEAITRFGESRSLL